MSDRSTGFDEVNILYQSSDAYAPVMGVSLTSLFENNKHIGVIRVYIVDGGISDESKQTILKLGTLYGREIYFLSSKVIDDLLEKKGVKKWRGSYAVFYKIYALDQIKEPINRLLAVDADTIINKDISPLYSLDLEGYTLGMIQDFMPYSYMKKIGMSDKDTYYNSGIVLYDIHKWTENKCQKQIEDFLSENYEKILYADQDAISIALQKEIKKLPINYNFFTIFSAMKDCLSFDLKTMYKLYDLDDLYNFYSVDELAAAEKEATVYHFEGGTVVGRPWEEGDHYSIFSLWDKYKAISPWSESGKMKSHATSFHKKEKTLHKILPAPVFKLVYKMAYDMYWRRILKIRPNS